MCSPKEPNFFVSRNVVANGDQDYERLFDAVKGEFAIGEASTKYLASFEAPGLIKKYIPNARIIVILRNPVDRTYSEFNFMRRLGRELEVDFWQTIQNEDFRARNSRIPDICYVRNSLYSEQLMRYYELFDKEQIRIYLHEDLQEQPEAMLANIFQFLGVDPSVKVSIAEKRNITKIPPNALVGQLVQDLSPQRAQKYRTLRAICQRVGIAWLYRRTYDHWISTALVKPDPLPKERRQELAKFFHDDILRVEKLIGRDLSHWLENQN